MAVVVLGSSRDATKSSSADDSPEHTEKILRIVTKRRDLRWIDHQIFAEWVKEFTNGTKINVFWKRQQRSSRTTSSRPSSVKEKGNIICLHAFSRIQCFELCKGTTITREPCRQNARSHIIHEAKFGIDISSHHWVNEEKVSRNNQRYATVVQDLAIQWNSKIPMHNKQHQRRWVSRSNRKFKVWFTLTIHWIWKKRVKIYIKLCPSTRNRSETHRTAERAVRSVPLYSPDSMNNGGHILQNVSATYAKIPSPLGHGQTPHARRIWQPCSGPIILFDKRRVLSDISEKSFRGSIKLAKKILSNCESWATLFKWEGAGKRERHSWETLDEMQENDASDVCLKNQKQQILVMFPCPSVPLEMTRPDWIEHEEGKDHQKDLQGWTKFCIPSARPRCFGSKAWFLYKIRKLCLPSSRKAKKFVELVSHSTPIYWCCQTDKLDNGRIARKSIWWLLVRWWCSATIKATVLFPPVHWVASRTSKIYLVWREVDKYPSNVHTPTHMGRKNHVRQCTTTEKHLLHRIGRHGIQRKKTNARPNVELQVYSAIPCKLRKTSVVPTKEENLRCTHARRSLLQRPHKEQKRTHPRDSELSQKKTTIWRKVQLFETL